MDETAAQKLQEWLNLLTVGKSLTTVSGYRWEISNWLRWGGQLAATTADLTRYLAERRGTVADASIKRSVAALRGYFAFCRPADNPAKAIPFPRVHRKRQRTPTGAQALSVITSCDTSTVLGSRDLALVCLLLDSGLRASEVCRLKLADVDLEARSLAVVVKGGHEAAGVFGQSTARYLARWLELRPLVALAETRTLFCGLGGNKRGTALTPGGLRAIFRCIGKRAGLAKGFSPHDLRRCFATQAILNGAPTRVVQVAGRWEDEKMVSRYTQDLQASDFDRYSPVERLMGGA